MSKSLYKDVLDLYCLLNYIQNLKNILYKALVPVCVSAARSTSAEISTTAFREA